MERHRKDAPSAVKKGGIRVGSAISTSLEGDVALLDASKRALEALGGAPVDLAFLFHSPDHVPEAEKLANLLLDAVRPGALLGCTTEAVVGEGQEVEGGPGIAVWLAYLAGATLHPFQISLTRTEEGLAVSGLPMVDESARVAIMLAEPASFPPQLLEIMARSGTTLPIIGGMASGQERVLILDGNVYSSGAVGVDVRGPVRIEALVSQGCRPIGRPYVVTKAERNVIQELAGQPPLRRLTDALSRLAPEERELMEGLSIGLVIDERKTDFGPGDFLIRNLGIDDSSGAIVVGDHVRVGQTVQFQVRDPDAADAELTHLLENRLRASEHGHPSGALMFTCNGRGIRFFGSPHHDVQTVDKVLGPLPLAGMFCAGEIGPVGGRNFLHGFTASMALFYDAPSSRPRGR